MSAHSQAGRVSAVTQRGNAAIAVVLVTLLAGHEVPVVLAGEPPAEKLDCHVYETKTTKLGAGLMVGTIAFSFLFGVPGVTVTPQITYERRIGIAWDRAVHGLVSRYVELCNRYNAGLVTKSEYEATLREIEALHKEAQALEAKLLTDVRSRADQEYDELNRAVGQGARNAQTPASLAASVEQFADQVDRLEPIGSPLKPTTPCPVPDALGAPGAQPGAEQSC